MFFLYPRNIEVLFWSGGWSSGVSWSSVLRVFGERVSLLAQKAFALASENQSAAIRRRLDLTATLALVSIFRTPCSP